MDDDLNADHRRDSSQTAVWRQGDLLVVPRDEALPPPCLKTGRDDDLHLFKKNLHGYSSFVFLGPIVDAVVFLATHRKTTISFWLSAQGRIQANKLGYSSIAVSITGFLCVLVACMGIAGQQSTSELDVSSSAWHLC